MRAIHQRHLGRFVPAMVDYCRSIGLYGWLVSRAGSLRTLAVAGMTTSYGLLGFGLLPSVGVRHEVPAALAASLALPCSCWTFGRARPVLASRLRRQ